MGQAFGISEEDVVSVLEANLGAIVNRGSQPLDDMAHDLLGRIDHGAVERAALKGGVDLDEQTEAAHEEIRRQLLCMGILVQTPARKARP